MRNRSDIIDDFLKSSGWPGAKRANLAGDASFRRYERITSGDRRAVLMDAPPEKEDVRPFLHIGGHLLKSGLSAPEIYARDVANGLLLLEDLGDDLFTPLLRKNPERESELYFAASDVLAALYAQAEKADFSGFTPYDEARLMREAALLSEWFLPAILNDSAAVPGKEYLELWRDLLGQVPALRPTLVLRDYHADNLLWLPERGGLKRVGLLDFQDGVIGSPAYDMVSFLEDARRDVAERTVRQSIRRYLDATRIPEKDFMAAYALLGAQRNCKIIGIFTRLAVRDGKRQYLSYLPRVWGHLERDLRHPLLHGLRRWMDETVPPERRGVIDTGGAAQATA